MKDTRQYYSSCQVAGRITHIYDEFARGGEHFRELLLDCSTPKTDENTTVVLTTDEPRMFEGLRKGQYIQATCWVNASFWGDQNEFHNLLWVRHLFTSKRSGK